MGEGPWRADRRRRERDPYIKAAQRDGYRARSAYKLEALDKAHGFLRRGGRVIDLGAAPGSWSQYAARRIGARHFDPPRLTAVDRTPIAPIPGVAILQADLFDDDLVERLKACLQGERADAALSDASPSASGRRSLDCDRSAALCERALELATALLAADGCFVCKILQGGAEPEFFRRLKATFAEARRAKPEASRRRSAELYLWGRGLRGG